MSRPADLSDPSVYKLKRSGRPAGRCGIGRDYNTGRTRLPRAALVDTRDRPAVSSGRPAGQAAAWVARSTRPPASIPRALRGGEWEDEMAAGGSTRRGARRGGSLPFLDPVVDRLLRRAGLRSLYPGDVLDGGPVRADRAGPDRFIPSPATTDPAVGRCGATSGSWARSVARARRNLVRAAPHCGGYMQARRARRCGHSSGSPTLGNRLLRQLLQVVTAKQVEKRDVTIEGLLQALGALDPQQQRSSRATSKPERTAGAERRQLTIVSCGLALASADGTPLDIEEQDQLLHAEHAVFEQLAARGGGHLGGVLGDRILFVFGYRSALRAGW
jgi:hypothetical protein